ncbi:MAG: biopolymer transporter ExbD [Bdellovibrionales bacterium]|nr:biopolymer transporter ExbD [Bdellovibrionales bacterium]
MGEVKGSQTRLIQTPGYHMKPKYDLNGLRERRTGGGRKGASEVLQITSLIDVFSMLVIFLLLNFSTQGEAYFVSKGLKLPETEHGNNMKSLALISITKDAVYFDAINIGNNPVRIEERDMNLPLLREKLEEIKALKTQLAPDKPFKGEVNISADQDIPILYVKRVMTTLISAGWTGINFATKGSLTAEEGADVNQ